EPEREVAALGVRGRVGRAKASPDQHGEEREDGGDAGEAQLLSDDAEDEVVVGGGKEEELLAARAEPDAEAASRAESEERFDRLVPATARIRPRIEEGQHAIEPVSGMPDEKEGDRSGTRGTEREVPQSRAGDE